MTTPTEYVISTTYGQISLWDSQAKGPAGLLIHGNSACKEVFRKQFESDLSKRFRLIAMDLPGHGKSEDAKEPEATYSLPCQATRETDPLATRKLTPQAAVGMP